MGKHKNIWDHIKDLFTNKYKRCFLLVVVLIGLWYLLVPLGYANRNKQEISKAFVAHEMLAQEENDENVTNIYNNTMEDGMSEKIRFLVNGRDMPSERDGIYIANIALGLADPRMNYDHLPTLLLGPIAYLITAMFMLVLHRRIDHWILGRTNDTNTGHSSFSPVDDVPASANDSDEEEEEDVEYTHPEDIMNGSSATTVNRTGRVVEGSNTLIVICCSLVVLICVIIATAVVVFVFEGGNYFPTLRNVMHYAAGIDCKLLTGHFADVFLLLLTIPSMVCLRHAKTSVASAIMS